MYVYSVCTITACICIQLLCKMRSQTGGVPLAGTQELNLPVHPLCAVCLLNHVLHCSWAVSQSAAIEKAQQRPVTGVPVRQYGWKVSPDCVRQLF